MAFRQLARIAHPDSYSLPAEKAAAHVVFTRLNLLYRYAEERITSGQYRNPDAIPADATFRIQSRRHKYYLTGRYTTSPYTRNYPGGYVFSGRYHPVDMHLAIGPDCSGLVRNEVAILRELQRSPSYDKFSPYLPELVEAFCTQKGTSEYAAIAFAGLDGWFSLQAVRERYPNGVDAHDMAWIYRRLLTVLGFLHSNGVIHCAVLPGNILIQPEQHGLMLVNFGSAFSRSGTGLGLPIACFDDERQWYPPDMLPGRIVTPATDLYLAARCMRYLLGAAPLALDYPADVPKPIAAFLRGCLMASTHSCPSDAWALKAELDDLLQQLWGKRKFHPFSMACQNQAAQYQGGKNG